MNMNTLHLIDYDSKYGTVYIANGGHITVVSTPYLFGGKQDVNENLVHHSIGEDDSYIRCVKVIHHSDQIYLMIIIENSVKFFNVSPLGKFGDKIHEFKLKGVKTITSVDIKTFKNVAHILIVDLYHTLYLFNFETKKVVKRDNVYSACFALDTIMCIVDEGNKILVLDALNIENQLAEHDLEISDMKSVNLLDKNSLFIFYGELFSLEIIEFENIVSRRNLTEFDFKKRTKFDKSFSSSDNMIANESAIYWIKSILNTKFIFSACSFSESAEIFYKSEEDNWTKASPKKQSLKLLVPSSHGKTYSFKGIIYYPFKFSTDENDTCKHKFIDEEIEIAFPRRIITLSYIGSIDIFECYFKNIKSYKNLDPEEMEESKSSSLNPTPSEVKNKIITDSNIPSKPSLTPTTISSSTDRSGFDPTSNLQSKTDLQRQKETEKAKKANELEETINTKANNLSEENDEVYKIMEMLINYCEIAKNSDSTINPLSSQDGNCIILDKIAKENKKSAIEMKRRKESNDSQGLFTDELIKNDGYLLQTLVERANKLANTIGMHVMLSYYHQYKQIISKKKSGLTEETKSFEKDIKTKMQSIIKQKNSTNEKDNKKLERLDKKDGSSQGDISEKSIKYYSNKELDKILITDDKNAQIDASKFKPEQLKLPKSVKFNSEVVSSKLSQRSRHNKESKINSILKEKQEDANKINSMVVSVGETDEEDDETDESPGDSDELDDSIGEMRPKGKLPLKKLKTIVPEALNMKCNPSELLEDFFDDPLEHPLIAANAFQKSKSEMVRPLFGLKSSQKKTSKKNSNKNIGKIEEEEEDKNADEETTNFGSNPDNTTNKRDNAEINEQNTKNQKERIDKKTNKVGK